MPDWYYEARDLADMLDSKKYPDGQPCGEAFWEAFLPHKSVEKRSVAYNAIFHALLEEDGPHLAEKGVRKFYEYRDTYEEALDFMAYASTVHGRRRFFVTEKGCMGWAPIHTCSGDLVCIILGAETPFVLRRHGMEQSIGNQNTPRFYSLVGECFVYGMMYGEMIDSSDEIEEFTLC
jgi:hypothetical protein